MEYVEGDALLAQIQKVFFQKRGQFAAFSQRVTMLGDLRLRLERVQSRAQRRQ